MIFFDISGSLQTISVLGHVDMTISTTGDSDDNAYNKSGDDSKCEVGNDIRSQKMHISPKKRERTRRLCEFFDYRIITCLLLVIIFLVINR